MGRSLFGTDGIRGVAGIPPLTALDMLRLGEALATHFVPDAVSGVTHQRVLVGRDTRRSGPMLEAALCAGLAAAGADVLRVGVLPTPAIAYLTQAYQACAGIVISASHNPFQDNGIKIFGKDGFKLSDDEEHDLEQRIRAQQAADASLESASHRGRTGMALGTLEDAEEARERYVAHLLSTVPPDFGLHGVRLVIDAAHGAACTVAGLLFRRLGAEVDELASRPDGQNINSKCGALHPEALQARVLETGADLGIALDGDADRLIMVDERGTLRNGDQLMALFACALKQRGNLPLNTLVATHMSNLGLERFLSERGIGLLRTAVGDRYVMEVLRAQGHPLGGEQSGHLLLLEHSTTGDGLLAALQALWILKSEGKSFSALLEGFMDYPQILLNTKVKTRRPLESLPAVQAAIAGAEQALGREGRVLVRFSGTEPLARVMIEGRDLGHIRGLAESIQQEIATALGTPV